MPNTELHPDSVARYPEQLERFERWACHGDEAARAELLEWARNVPAIRIKTPPGPVFWYGSGALANKRLFELRLATCYGDDMGTALAAAASKRECPGELAVITAILADRAGIAEIGTLKEKMADGIFRTLPLVAPGLFTDNLVSLIGKGSYRVWYKWALLGLVPWEQSVSAKSGGKVLWVTRFDRAVLSAHSAADAKKGSFAIRVAETMEERDEVWSKAVAAAERRHGLSLVEGMPEIDGLNLPRAEEIDLGHAAHDAARRDQVIRGLGVQSADRWPILSHLGSNHGAVMAFEMLKAGHQMRGKATKTGTDILTDLRRALLPGHFETLCQRAWGDSMEANLARFDISL